MNKYSVTYYFHTEYSVEVEAYSKEDAKIKAKQIEIDQKQLLENIEETCGPIVLKID